MQLPEHLHLSEPTLILRADHQQADFHMADSDSLELLEQVHLDKETFSDNEASGANPGTSESHDGEAHKRFAKMLAEGMAHLFHDAGVGRMYVAAPADVLSALEAQLPQDVKAHMQKTITANLMKSSMLDVVTRFHETMAKM